MRQLINFVSFNRSFYFFLWKAAGMLVFRILIPDMKECCCVISNGRSFSLLTLKERPHTKFRRQQRKLSYLLEPARFQRDDQIVVVAMNGMMQFDFRGGGFPKWRKILLAFTG